jgi:uncharacterized protein YndB with AHSA1/START domain
MEKSSFVYVTFIRTTPQKLWRALTDPDFMRSYFFGAAIQPDPAWKKGASWQMQFANGMITDQGEVLEVVPPKRLVLRWRNEFMPALKAEGYSRCVMTLEPMKGAVKLTITHTMDRPKSKLIDAVSGGWPQILSNLKSLLETGKVPFKEKPPKAKRPR